MSYKSRLLGMTALPLLAALGAAIATDGISVAHAQTNPCAPAARPANPCAPAARPANPCAAAPRAVNPCAASQPRPAVNPCAAARGVNPCAARPAIVGPAMNPYDVAAKHKQAPYGDAMPPIVKNYLRAAPYVGTGGIVDPKGFAELKKLGFKTIINLNTHKEGAQEEGKGIMAAGLDYVSIPVPAKAPDANAVAAFSKYVNDPNTYPVLVHCVSSNRVGAMWALYRAENGVPPEIAIQEGRTVGLKPSREAAVRAILKLPPLAN
jgi:uncharacterized protein (TIGR01244 family)